MAPNIVSSIDVGGISQLITESWFVQVLIPAAMFMYIWWRVLGD